jgi:hypothetical protein
MTALPLGSSVESLAASAKERRRRLAGGDEVAGRERSDREFATSADPNEGASRGAAYEGAGEQGVTRL